MLMKPLVTNKRIIEIEKEMTWWFGKRKNKRGWILSDDKSSKYNFNHKRAFISLGIKKTEKIIQSWYGVFLYFANSYWKN